MQQAIHPTPARGVGGWWRGFRASDAFHAVFANPIVVRDLRAQMRGTKSYWYQAAYLLLLGVLAVSGYARAVNLGQIAGITEDGRPNPLAAPLDIVAAQGRLENFYYFIFLTLAGLVTLIAPALTAASVTGERQRLSLDLLVTTPLSAFELLVGKLLSSVAFLGLLLALSLPASALCVLLGGATITDVFRVYLLLAIDGVVLSAIGLFFSCAARTNLSALAWTYAAVAGFLLATAYVALVGGGGFTPAGMLVAGPALALGLLNPFVAVLPMTHQTFEVGVLSIPFWIGTAACAALGLRLLLTAATYRLGLHGNASATSLRKQGLLIAGLTAFAICFRSVFSHPAASEGVMPSATIVLATMLIPLFLLVLPFLPALFVPASGEDAPPGISEAQMPNDPAPYRMRLALLPVASGALPYFHLWLAVTVLGMGCGYFFTRGAEVVRFLPPLLLAAFYLSGVGFLLWSMSRLASRLLPGLSSGRALAFGGFVLLLALPMLVISLTANGSWENHPLAPMWIAYPLMKSNSAGGMMTASVVTGAYTYALGGLFARFDSWLPRRK